MIIDSHHHLWTADYPWLSADELAPIRRDYTVADLRDALRQAGVDGTVLVEAGRCDLEETRSFLALAAETPEIRGVVGWVSFEAADLRSTVDELRAGSGGTMLSGLRDQVQAVSDPGYLARPAVRSNLSAAGVAGLAVDLVVRLDQLPACAEIAAAVPETTFVLDHLGKPRLAPDGLAEWQALVAPLAARPNVVAKLSGLLTQAPAGAPAHIDPFVDVALDLFGPDRLMIGSDWPVCELAASYADTWHTLLAALAGLSPGERAKVLGGTAIHTYRL